MTDGNTDQVRQRALAELEVGFRDAGALEDFHRRHKLLLMAHSPGRQKELGRLVARAPSDLEDVARDYRRLCGETLTEPATRGGHINALQHARGYLKRQIPSEEKSAFDELLESYRRGLVERRALTAMLRQWIRRYGAPYLEQQSYVTGEHES
jgi:uncharacterized protein YbgA (DUF1722 family)